MTAWELVLKSLHELHEKVDRLEAKLARSQPALDPVGDAVKAAVLHAACRPLADAAKAQGSA